MQDRHRPVYHFLPPANWMNDPNGLIQWEGSYHLFYQHNPFQPYWGNMHWGHAVSADLVHWRHLPIALAPTPNGPDKDGCFTGCAVNNRGVPTLVYTGVHPEVQCLATGSSDLVRWEKHAGNPIIAAPPSGLEVTGFRDPFVWFQDGCWYMVLGSGLKGRGGTALLYVSPDLEHWRYLHPIYVGDEAQTGYNWECPNFFALQGSHVLVVSAQPLHRALYFVGEWHDLRFEPRRQGLVDAGEYFYAPQTFEDEKGRRLMFGWLCEGRSREDQIEAGWAGVMSLPRELSIGLDGRLKARPVEELQTLRRGHVGWRQVIVSGRQVVPGVIGDALEILVRLRACKGRAGLEVRVSQDGEEGTRIVWDGETRTVSIDARRSSLDMSGDRSVVQARVPAQDDVTLHVFVDRSVIEVFANGTCLSSRVYPTRADSLGSALIGECEPAHLLSVDIWELGSAS